MICARHGLLLNFIQSGQTQGDLMPRISTLTRYLPGWLLFLAVLISACSLVGNYQPRAHAQLTDLMAAHLQFIDDFTAPSGVLDTAALEDADHTLQLRFAEALAYAESLGDPLRTDNLRLLQSVYQEDHARLLKQHRPFTPAQAALWRDQARLAYLEAVRGECRRPASPCE
ncbi:hypothetical protein SMZ27_002499 [Cronobacter sakazakii]|nr:hypothetical protein [Cronobacter sakazakii]EJG0746999.1 hypothetical protein [Cronobacter sakazakii]ELQ6037844.1 hypothetical protein [Cronobacter sakazakii]ELY2535611.1 hypothetical protein [Cronobacter sakazakii]ELY2539508.1 hypothetical protein [Cronobacter sakazakii]